MNITAKTWNGNTLNDANYKAAVINPGSTPNANAIFIGETNADAVDAGIFSVDVRDVTVAISVENYANRDALIAQLRRWFKRGTKANLVATFGDDGADYQLQCRVVNLIRNADFPYLFYATLQSGQSAWVSVAAETDSWTLTGTSGTKMLTVGGKDETCLSLSLNAGGLASDFAGFHGDRVLAPLEGFANFFKHCHGVYQSYLRPTWAYRESTGGAGHLTQARIQLHSPRCHSRAP